MSLNNARQSIFSYLNDNFSSAIKVFDGSDRGDALIKGTAPWIYTCIIWDKENQVSMGTPNAKFERIGSLSIKLYVRLSDGVGTVDSITDDLLSVFRSKKIGNSLFEPASIRSDQEYKDIWTIRMMLIPFSLFSDYQII